MKKILLVMFMSIYLLALVSAMDYYKQSEELNFKESCTISGAVCNASASCNLTLRYPNSSYVVANGNMTNNNNGDFNYTLTSLNLSTIGVYSWSMYCCQAGECGEGHDQFTINSIGVELTTARSMIYGISFVVLILFFVFILFIVGRLPSGNEREGEFISISWLKYLKSTLLFIEWLILTSIFYVSSNIAFAFLGEQLFAKLLHSLYRITFSMTLPIIVIWFIWVFVNIVQDKKLKRAMEKGLFESYGGRF